MNSSVLMACKLLMISISLRVFGECAWLELTESAIVGGNRYHELLGSEGFGVAVAREDRWEVIGDTDIDPGMEGKRPDNEDIDAARE